MRALLERVRGGEWRGLALLACALAFNAVLLAPELSISRVPLNDDTFHLAASERLGESLARGEPFLDPWVSEWALGYPVWRSYQPLGHLLAAAALAPAPATAHPAVFAALQYVLLLLFPVSVYLGARLLGLSPGAAGIAACLALAPSEAGELGRYGLGYGAFVWRGSGLFTQIVALDLLAPSLGLVVRALDTGRHRLAAAASLALTSLAHIIFGYVAFVSAALLALAGPRGERARRLVRLATVVVPALLLLAWFVAPLVLSAGTVNHSRWEEAVKWDSYGAPAILGQLATGQLLDAGRLPVLTLLAVLGAAAAALAWREALPRRLLVLAGAWLALFFGRATWGHLTLLAGVPADLHMHRLQGAFELAAVLLAAWGTARLAALAWKRDRRLGAVAAVAAAAALTVLGADRARYLGENAAWGRESLAAYRREKPEIDAALAEVRDILARRPGRVSAGPAAGWGRDFKVGAVPFYAFLTRAHMDEVSFLYHSMSRAGDVMVLADPANRVDDVVFGVRAVVAPAARTAPPFWQPRGVFGRFAVYEVSPEGYFGLGDAGARYTGPSAAFYETSAAWLKGPLPVRGVVADLNGGDPALPAFGRWQPLPRPPPAASAPRGTIVSEDKTGEVYTARVVLLRPCDVLVKVSWDPGLRATVDGRAVRLEHVTPGFGAVAVPAGAHTVRVEYRPGPLRGILLLAGIAAFAGWGVLLRRRRTGPREAAAAAWLAGRTARLDTSRQRAALAVALLVVLAGRPLLRGRLVDGHDATEYPPRVVEFARTVADGQVPPLWAPDLGSGHGQPLFEFAPPLLYAAALPFRAAGAGLADSVQLALLLLLGAGAAAVYRLARRWEAGRAAAVAVTALWLFAPYLSLDLFVRAAFAEAAAVAVAPAALLGVLRACDRPTAGRIVLGGAAVALVVLAHNAVALLLLPVLAAAACAAAACASAARPRPAVRRLAGGAGALAAGLGLSAFFWVPALAERTFVKVELLRQGFLSWHEHAISPAQLAWSKWGFGVSGPGPDGMSFAVGALLLLLGAAGLAAVWQRGAPPRRRAEAAVLAVAALAGMWLATTWSAPVWRHLPTLQYLAYPWRCLFLPAVVLPVLAAPALARLPRPAIAAVVLAALALNLPHTEPKGYLTFDDAYYAPASIAARGLTTTTREEYEPRWVVVRPPAAAPRLAGVSAPVEILEARVAASRQTFTVRAPAATAVEAATFFYPGWRVSVDGSLAPLSVVPVHGTMAFSVPAGQHRVVLELVPTRLRRLAGAASAATAAALALMILAAAWRRRRLTKAG